MLREAVEFLLTRCPAEARRFGYASESVALGARWRRRRRAWASHVAAARRFVADAAGQVPPGGRVLIAGSGHTTELPLETLLARFAEVVLVDLVHPPAVRLRALAHRRVRLVTLDVTGALADVRTSLARGGGLPVPPPAGAATPAAAGQGSRFDLALSCNLLSQLPLLPLDAAERDAPALAEAERLAFATALVTAHLAWLRRAGRVASLFTDTEGVWLDRTGAVRQRDDSLWGVSLAPPDRVWAWDIAPAPEADPELGLRHTVGAWFDLNRAAGQADAASPDSSTRASAGPAHSVTGSPSAPRISGDRVTVTPKGGTGLRTFSR